ncbi:MAG TPA: HAD family hydrolase [Candidatus Limnocylindria bacterium]|jgi:putative hydrolase of the HAD superfamily|nr:HAD family hydrolase [Candidatus Limnocylindria bacterium]
MTAPRAVVFDLGGTLVQWTDWEDGAAAKWALAYDALRAADDGIAASRDAFVAAMRAAEKAHWERVEREQWSGPPQGLVNDGFRRLGVRAGERAVLAALDGYARAVAGWCTIFADTRDTLATLRERGYRLGLLSNTWWAADWHNADLAAHGLADLLDVLVYTSDLGCSKPHPSAFREVASRLGVAPEACVMIGDRQIDDVSGARAVGMRAIWRRNESGFPTSDVAPDAIVDALAELPALLRSWNGA